MATTFLPWFSPNGVEHLTVLVPGGIPGMAQGKCVTCGRVHEVGHALTVARFGEQFREPCRVVASGWPYECVAKDKHPGDVVFVCEPHAVWWHEPRV
jgi:hypothetical protein